MRRLLPIAAVAWLASCSSRDPTPAAVADAAAEDTTPIPDTAAPEDAPAPAEDVAAAPDVAIPKGTEFPPDVPETGWANAVVASNILASIDLDGKPIANVAADPQKAVGPPDGDSAGTVALGVVGNGLVLDLGEGEEAFDGEGPDLVVIEMGFDLGGIPEPYRVYVAAAPDGPFVAIGDGSSKRGFDLAASGMKSARYVRVESRSDEAMVLSGLGSPAYPGPEIDAVGAIFPGGVP